MASFFRKLTPAQIVWAGCALTLLYAVFSRGAYHPDEHYQILEYATMKLFGTPQPSELPWEYETMMRPGLQPMIAYAVGWLLDAAGAYNPWLLAFLLRLLSGAVSVAVLLVFYRAVRDTLPGEAGRKGFLLLSLFLWCTAFLHVRFSSETLSGNLLLLLVALYFDGERRGFPRPLVRGLLLGLIAGGAFAVRYQTGFALLGLGIWLFAFGRRWRLIGGMAAGFAATLAAGALADRWLYGVWTCAPVNYIRENLLNAHMESFGVDPWYRYLEEIVLGGGIVPGLLMLAGTLYYFYRHPRGLLTWMLVPFLLAHQFVAHKEARFLFPMLPLAIYFVVLMLGDLPRRLWSHRAAKPVLWTLVVLNGIALAATLALPKADIHFYRTAERYCAGKPRVVVLSLSNDFTYYVSGENVIRPRTIVCSFYMPRNVEYHTFDSPRELCEKAASYCRECPDVFWLSQDPEVGRTGPVEARKVDWRPFPKWVVEHFNINNWTERSLRRRNIYRLVPRNGSSARSE